MGNLHEQISLPSPLQLNEQLKDNLTVGEYVRLFELMFKTLIESVVNNTKTL